MLLGSALVGLSGGTTGTPEWGTGQLWVSLSYVLWLVAVALLLLVVVPAQGRAAGQIEAGQDAARACRRARSGCGPRRGGAERAVAPARPRRALA